MFGDGWLGPALTLGSSLVGAVGSSKAADAQSEAADKSLAFQREVYNQNRTDLEPWRLAGVNALAGMGDLLNNPGSFTQSPGYQFRLGEGVKALDRSAAARGMLNSGATGKALTRYGQDFASNEFGNQWNRLASMAGIGQTATNAGVGSANQSASGMGNTMLAGGQARASGYTGMANAANQGIGNLLYLYGK